MTQNHVTAVLPNEKRVVKGLPSIPEEIRERLRKEAWRFDIYGLVELLLYLGFSLRDIELTGHQGLESQPGLIRQLEFKPTGRVEITLYFGIAGANGVIPTYLMKMADTGVINERHFHELIAFFDRYLLKTWLQGMLPEMHLQRLGQTRWLRSLNNFGSLSNIIWLFTQVFPDLQVRVSRKAMNLGRLTRPAKIGVSKIGIEMILGNEFRVLTYGYQVVLIADHEDYKSNRPWHIEIQQRFTEQIRPVLANMDIYVEIWLTIRSTKSWFRINKDGNYLGYERLKGGDDPNKRIHIFSGYIETEGSETV